MKIRYYRDPLAPGKVAQTRDPFISSASYAEMVEKTPIPCTDAVLTLKGDKALYLVERSVYPMKGVWCLGGRIWFNDHTLHDSIARCVEIETGQHFAPERFTLVSAPHLYSWVRTRQGEFPGKNLAVTFNLQVDDKELNSIAESLKPEEYNTEFGVQRFSRERLVDEKVHQAMLDVYDDIFPSP